jgi:oligopeptide transport system ATP-binding protein
MTFLPSEALGEHPKSEPPAREELLRIEDLTTHFAIKRGLLRRVVGYIHAVDGVTLSLSRGETLALVGESGCGKTTLVRTIIGLEKPRAGRILFCGEDVTGRTPARRRALSRDLQYVYQNPYGSLNPRKRVGATIREPLVIHRIGTADEQRRRVEEVMERMGLQADHARRFPHQFSGGQRQRIGIARAMILNPKVLILDEPVSALDVSIQAQIINLLQDIQDELDLSYILIAHDLAVVEHIADRVAVMYLGRVVELGTPEEIHIRPQHPYTQALLAAVPPSHPRDRVVGESLTLEGDPPSPRNPPSGCRFRTRCWKATELCAEVVPVLEVKVPDGQLVACHHVDVSGSTGA